MKELLIALALAVALAACAGLSSKDQVAVACKDVQLAGDAIADAAERGQVSKADAAKARDLYHSTDKFCEPVADKLSASDYATLAAAAASLVTQQKGISK